MTTKTQYKDEVIGRDVVILFKVDKKGTTQPFLGQVRAVEIEMKDDGTIETSHLIFFDDGDERWFFLAHEEEEGRLTWVSDRPGKVRHIKQKQESSAKKKRKITPGSNRVSNGSNMDCEYSGASDDGRSFTSAEEYNGEDYMESPTGAEWSDRLYHFFTRIPHGTRRGVLEPPKAKSVITQINSVTSFQGLYHGLSKKMVFAGRKVDFCSDLYELIEEAKQYENSYDSLQYPLRKMQDYKNYYMQN